MRTCVVPRRDHCIQLLVSRYICSKLLLKGLCSRNLVRLFPTPFTSRATRHPAARKGATSRARLFPLWREVAWPEPAMQLLSFGRWSEAWPFAMTEGLYKSFAEVSSQIWFSPVWICQRAKATFLAWWCDLARFWDGRQLSLTCFLVYAFPVPHGSDAEKVSQGCKIQIKCWTCQKGKQAVKPAHAFCAAYVPNGSGLKFRTLKLAHCFNDCKCLPSQLWKNLETEHSETLTQRCFTNYFLRFCANGPPVLCCLPPSHCTHHQT